jgi:hypothetical protein
MATLITTNPNDDRPAMTADGQFLCSKCIAENRQLIDSAVLDDCPDVMNQWGIVGYCGDDDLASGYTINTPESGDTCAHCYRAL